MLPTPSWLRFRKSRANQQQSTSSSSSAIAIAKASKHQHLKHQLDQSKHNQLRTGALAGHKQKRQQNRLDTDESQDYDEDDHYNDHDDEDDHDDDGHQDLITSTSSKQNQPTQGHCHQQNENLFQQPEDGENNERFRHPSRRSGARPEVVREPPPRSTSSPTHQHQTAAAAAAAATTTSTSPATNSNRQHRRHNLPSVRRALAGLFQRALSPISSSSNSPSPANLAEQQQQQQNPQHLKPAAEPAASRNKQAAAPNARPKSPLKFHFKRRQLRAQATSGEPAKSIQHTQREQQQHQASTLESKSSKASSHAFQSSSNNTNDNVGHVDGRQPNPKQPKSEQEFRAKGSASSRLEDGEGTEIGLIAPEGSRSVCVVKSEFAKTVASKTDRQRQRQQEDSCQFVISAGTTTTATATLDGEDAQSATTTTTSKLLTSNSSSSSANASAQEIRSTLNSSSPISSSRPSKAAGHKMDATGSGVSCRRDVGNGNIATAAKSDISASCPNRGSKPESNSDRQQKQAAQNLKVEEGSSTSDLGVTDKAAPTAIPTPRTSVIRRAPIDGREAEAELNLIEKEAAPGCKLTARTSDNHCALHGRDRCPLAPDNNNIKLLTSASPPSPPPFPQGSGGSGGVDELASSTAKPAPDKMTTITRTSSKTTTKTNSILGGKRKRRRGRGPSGPEAIPTWPLGRQSLDLKQTSFGDCEDLFSPYLAGRLFQKKQHFVSQLLETRARDSLQFHQASNNNNSKKVKKSSPRASAAAGAFRLLPQTTAKSTTTQTQRLPSVRPENKGDSCMCLELIVQNGEDVVVEEGCCRCSCSMARGSNYNHRRPFGQSFERPTAGWIYNATGPAKINRAESLKAKLFAASGFRRGSYDDQEGDTDINIILQPSDLHDIEKKARRMSLERAEREGRIKALSSYDGSLSSITNRTNDLQLAKCLLDQDYNLTVQLFINRSALNWNFNSFTFDALCCGRSLTELLLHLFDYYNLYKIFNLNIINVLKCFKLLEFGYHSTNPYHNSIHAADVTQAMHCFMQEDKIKNYMTPLELLSSILAAVCHDLDHPGVNQSFLVATQNPLAGLYNNLSVLENHHWRFAICIFKESQLFDHFEPKLYDEMKLQMKQLILATDIARQNEYLKRFKELTQNNNKKFSMSNSDDRALVLQMALKCADLGNPCRPWLISRVWSNLICDEFYKMGQIERQLGIPLTPICQREKTSIAGIQTDFFKFIVLPLLDLWHNFLQSPLSSLLMSNFDHNYQRWQRANRIVQQWRRRKSLACLEPIHDDQQKSNNSNIQTKSSKTTTTTTINTSNKQQQLRRTNKNNKDNFFSIKNMKFINYYDEDYNSEHSYDALKRASSDYIKSGNGKLELLRFKLYNANIEFLYQ